MDATCFRNQLVATGGVIEREGEDGRTVALDVVMNDARVEDILRLAVKTEPSPMTGAVKLKANFVLPPGHGHTIEKLRLAGSFDIGEGRFGGGELSRRDSLLAHSTLLLQAAQRERGPELLKSRYDEAPYLGAGELCHWHETLQRLEPSRASLRQ